MTSARKVWIDANIAFDESPDSPFADAEGERANEAAALVIATALDEARAEERRKVVEWLREPDGDWPRATAYSGILADAIEKGDHLKAQEKQG